MYIRTEAESKLIEKVTVRCNDALSQLRSILDGIDLDATAEARIEGKIQGIEQVLKWMDLYDES